jgi:hypothetical protein
MMGVRRETDGRQDETSTGEEDQEKREKDKSIAKW